LLVISNRGSAVTENNPYSAISGRNVFSLRPPPAIVATNTAPVTPAPGIELQGFTTILGRPQVLLKVKVPPKPPEPAKDHSLVMDIGQREGDVEVISMDAYAGTVNLKNQGNLVSLNLKENAAKPAAGPAISAPSMLPKPGSIPPPPGANPATPASGGGIPLPTRSLRSGGDTGASSTHSPSAQGGFHFNQSQQIAAQRTAEENAALRLSNQLRREQSGEVGPLIRDPRLKQMVDFE
jgi:hypothetical protein